MRVGRGTVVGSLLVAVLAGDVAGVLHVSGEVRASERAAAADAAWVAGVSVVAEQLLSARAPISDAAHFVTGVDLGPAVRYDVYVRGAATADFTEVAAELAAVAVPTRRRETHDALGRELAAMSAAVLGLADEQNTDVEDELRAFDVAAAAWDRLIGAHVAQDLPLATTQRPGLPLTRAGQLFRWSSACAGATFADDELPDPGDDPAGAAALFDGFAAHLDRTLTELLAIPPGPDQAGVQRELEPALKGMRAAVPALRAFGTAVTQRDDEAFESASTLLDRLDPLYEQAARSFEARGSTVCSDYFDPGLVDPSGPQDDVTAT